MAKLNQKEAGDGFPLLMSTSEAARYIAGRGYPGKVNSYGFLQFARRCGLRPKFEKTVMRRCGNEEITYVRQIWSRRQIDRALA